MNEERMSSAEAKEYILALLTTLKLTEAEIRSLDGEAAKWEHRTDLARSQGKNDLLAGAEKEIERVNAKKTKLLEEAESHKIEIEKMRKQLPGIAARERSIDTI